MKLTIEEEPQSLKRFGHIRPTPFWRRSCGVQCPGTTHTCTLDRHHRGPHVAHASLLRRVVAVWQGEDERRGRAPTRSRPTPAARRGAAGPLPLARALRERLTHLPSVEEVVFLVLFLSFVWFVIDWAIRMATGTP